MNISSDVQPILQQPDPQFLLLDESPACAPASSDEPKPSHGTATCEPAFSPLSCIAMKCNACDSSAGLATAMCCEIEMKISAKATKPTIADAIALRIRWKHIGWGYSCFARNVKRERGRLYHVPLRPGWTGASLSVIRAQLWTPEICEKVELFPT